MSRSITLQHATLVLPQRIRSAPLCIADGRVVAEAPADALVLDLRGHLILPGLINAHDHLQLNNIPRLPQREPFPNSYAWIAAFQPYFRDPAVTAACAVPETLRYWQGGLKNLLCGVTTVMHHDAWRPLFDDPVFPVRVLRRYGWSHSLGLGHHLDKLTSVGPEVVERGQAGQVADSSHHVTPLPTYGPPVVESFAATPPDTPWFIHLAEGTDAVAAAELAHLDALGCLAANTVLIHAVGLTGVDVERVIARRAGVIWCPESNLSMLGQTLRPRHLFDAGRLALGSDSRLSGSRDLLDELRVAAAHSNLTPAELLRLVTVQASQISAWPEVGGLSPGQLADMLIMRDTGSDPYQIVLDLQRSHIRAVVRGGVPAIADPDFASWFAACGAETVPVMLDGRRKLIAAALLGPPGAMGLEVGLSRADV